MKLSDWAKKQGISYLTAYRWFRDGKLPVNAYQSGSGTIIVQDDEFEFSEKPIQNTSNAVAHFLKKTIEFSKANGSVEDLAAYVLSNYKLEMQGSSFEFGTKLKTKPTHEMTSGHFKQFLKKDTAKPAPNMMLMDQDALNDIISNSEDPNLLERLKGANIIEMPLDLALTKNEKINNMTPEMGMLTNSQDKMSTGVFNRADLQNYGSVVSPVTPGALSADVAASSGFPGDVSATVTLVDIPNVSPLPVIKLESDGRKITTKLEAWRKVFEDEAQADPDFYVKAHAPVDIVVDPLSSKNVLRTYDVSRALVDLLLEAKMLSEDNMLVIDRQAKEICTWSKEDYEAIKQIAEDKLFIGQKKSLKKGSRKGK